MEQRKLVEAAARKAGVALAPTSAPTAEPGKAPMPGWMRRAMPAAADMLAELKGSMDPAIWAEAADRLKRGGGYVVDLTTNIAIGSPPVHEWERGRTEVRDDGFTIMRVRRLR
jgi:hypothetical protein